MRVITGLFNDQNSAENADKTLSESGYRSSEIDVIMSEETRQKYFGKATTLETEVVNKAAEGAAIGGALGSKLGAFAAAITAVGTPIAIPGLGLVIAGPIAGAGAGGLTAGIVGALIGWDMPEDLLKEYEQGINNGGILIGVKSKSEVDANRFEKDWKNMPRDPM